ncbi:hypothetical protein [Bordetella muralis]|jgi:hypothetical protein
MQRRQQSCSRATPMTTMVESAGEKGPVFDQAVSLIVIFEDKKK